MARPKYVTDEHLKYLDELRKSGVTNMYGATSYIIDEFSLQDEEKIAGQILSYWMESFSKDDR